MNSLRTRAWIVVLLVSVLGFAAVAEGKVVYVATTGNDANDGLSWATAKLTVQAGLNTAVADDQVWVAAGTYVELITLKAEVALYGGFSGNETDLTQRNWAVNKAILDGNAQGTVVTSPSGAGTSTRIDGFTIGNGKGSPGGGISCTSSSPTIANNTIMGNKAGWFTGSAGDAVCCGGGIYSSGGSPTITGNTITDNRVDGVEHLVCSEWDCYPSSTGALGGGIYVSGGSPRISGNSIIGNTVVQLDLINGGISVYGSDGGGIYCDFSSPTIEDNTIASNTAYSGGAGIYCNRCSAAITNNSITGNTATRDGGGIGCYSSSVTVSNNRIAGNAAGQGGGFYCVAWPSFPVDVTILNNIFTDNRASLCGGGIYSQYFVSPTIVNNVFASNSAERGGGINCDGGDHSSVSPRIANNTIVENTATGGGGGGIECRNSATPTITNTIIAFNSSGVFFQGTGTPVLQFNCVYGNAAYNYWGLSDPTGTNRNISVDPKLADRHYGNMHIQPDSPCKEGGNDVVQAGLVDIDGQPRIQGDHLDIGADESDGTVWPTGPSVIVRVSPEGNDANDGSSWTSAKRTVNAGIVAASKSSGEVWVKVGTYLERITLLPHVYVYGGFAGTESKRSERTWSAYPTILDGQQGGPVVSVPAGHQVSAIDGFTIRNGKATNGGGIYCSSSSPTITNTTVVANAATLGGGIYCSSSSAIIANCTIAGNTASDDGGGIYCDGLAGSSPPTIANTIVAFNSSGIYATQATLHNSCVYGNLRYDCLGLADPTGTSGNISADPKLAAASNGNLHIQPDSPCKDAGDDSVVQADWLDMEGQPRILDGHVDIGADESDGTVWPDEPVLAVRVSLEGNDANDGLSWGSAKRTVQAAIDAASQAGGGDIWVKAGVYAERITLPPRAHLYGGFVGTETQRRQRDWTANVTVLDGSQGGSVMTAAVPTGQELSTIDGFTLRNGKGGSSGGGGIYCESSFLTIKNNTIVGNTGEGVVCSNSSPTITNNTITGNSQHGIKCISSKATITDNTITGNRYGIICYYLPVVIENNTIAENTQTGITCYQSSPVIANNDVKANAAGGISCVDASSPVITNNVISGNTVSGSGNGGGICGSSLSTMTITGNTIADNTAFYGAGIYCPAGDSSTISANTIVNNRASQLGGGIYCYTAIIRNNVIAGNSASSGGGIYCVWSPTILNNTIVGNTASEGGGVCCRTSNSRPSISNTIIAFNSSGIRANGGALSLQSDCVYGNTGYNYSGMTDPTGTDGNISVDPRLARLPSAGADGTWGTADDDYGDLHLPGGSPCIDAGNNAKVPSSIVTDLDGLSRFVDDPATVDTGLGTPPIVDMGAYEYQPSFAIVSAVSVKTHGAAGDMAIDILAPDAVESRADGPTRLVVTFSVPIQAVDGAFDAGDEVTVSGGTIYALDVAGAQLTIDLSDVPNATCLTIGLQGIAQIGDSVPIAPTTLAVAALLGDVDGDRHVNVLDLISVRNSQNVPVTPANLRFDVAADGNVNVVDLITVRNSLNKIVWEPCAGSGQ